MLQRTFPAGFIAPCLPTKTDKVTKNQVAAIGPDVSGNAPQDEQVGQNVDHIDRLELAGDTDRRRGHSSADPRLWVAVRAELLVYGACIRRDAGALRGPRWITLN
jgi:hypothetical protein